MYNYLTVSANVCTTFEFNIIISAYSYHICRYIYSLYHMLNTYPSPMYHMTNANWSAFLKSILLTLWSHKCNALMESTNKVVGPKVFLTADWMSVWPRNVMAKAHCVDAAYWYHGCFKHDLTRGFPSPTQPGQLLYLSHILLLCCPDINKNLIQPSVIWSLAIYIKAFVFSA